MPASRPFLEIEKAASGKIRECRLVYLLDSHSQTKGKKILRKSGNNSQNGNFHDP